MSINFSQFPTPTLPINPGDFVVGYQNLGTGGVPTLAQYTMTQLFSGVFPGGTVPVSQGGTGQTTLIANGVLIGEGTSPVNSVVPGTTGTMLLSNGAGIDPSFGSNPVLNGATAVTQPRIDNTTLVATDAFVNQQIASSTANVPVTLVGGVYNQASLGTGASFVIFASGGVIGSILSIVNGGSGYAVGDLLLVIGGNYDAIVRVTNVSGGVIQSGGLSVLYGGTAYTTGATTGAVPVPPGQRTVTATGVLTSNVTFIIQNGTFLTAARRIQFNNNTTGAFTVTVKLSNGAGGSVGTGVVIPQGTNNSSAVLLETDGVNDVWLADTAVGIGALPITGGTVTGNMAVTGTFTPSQTNGIVGTTTNNNANAGSVGEFLSVTTLATSLSTGVAANVATLSLTAGDWEVFGTVSTNPAAGTIQQYVIAGLSLTTGTLPNFPNLTALPYTSSAGNAVHSPVPNQRISIGATTSIFLVANVTFTVSTLTANGSIRARRLR